MLQVMIVFLVDLLQAEHDVDAGQADHWQDAITKDGDNSAKRDAAGRHQAEQRPHSNAAHHADAVNVAEVHFAALQTEARTE